MRCLPLPWCWEQRFQIGGEESGSGCGFCRFLGLVARPGNGFVIVSSRVEAAVEDTCQTVAQRAEGGVVANAVRAELAVVFLGAGRDFVGAVRPLIAGVGNASFLGNASDHLLAFA